MVTRFEVTKYVVYSKTFDRFWNPRSNCGSIYYSEADFTDSLDKAIHFVTEQNAVDRALVMKKQFDTVALPLTITGNLSTTEVVGTLPKRAQKALELVDELSRMSDEHVDSLTNDQFKKYRNAKVYLKEHNLI